MPSHPTRQAAYLLRRTEFGREENFQFQSRKELVIALARQCKRGSDDQRSAILAFSSDRMFLSVLRQSSIQTSHSKFGAVWELRTDSRVDFEAFGPAGKSLNIKGLLESSLSYEIQAPRSRRGGIYCGYGPVPNVHRQRLGRRYFRRIATMQERRLNQPLNIDKSEPSARPARRAPNLPSSWDDISYARRSKGWKQQSKVRKSWLGQPNS
jgi:hypothetical protein